MSLLVLGCVVLSALFSLLSLGLPLGESVGGFLLAAGYTVAFAFFSFRFRASPGRSRLAAYRKSLEYLPFVLFAAFVMRRSAGAETSYANDVASALLWVAVVVTTFVIQYRLSDKRVSRYYPELGAAEERPKSAARHALEWIDALVQAACLVLIINLFFFQLYAIPSESMVPEFMIGDRVVVVKTPSGPKFPLTDVGIPRMRGYERGDIVVFSNPHYNDTREARVTSFASQLVYMLSFTAVNINRDEFGRVKADPLVKRVTGVPGEKLMMVDGVLYSKRAGDGEFSPVAEDASWASWDVASLPRSELALVKNVPMTKEAFADFVSVESRRANLDLDAARREAESIVRRFASLKRSPDTVVAAPELFPRARFEVLSLFQSSDEIARVLLTTNGGYLWFRDFMTAWASTPNRANLHDDRAERLNVMMKLAFGRLVVRNAELLTGNVTAGEYTADPARNGLFAEADSYLFYLARNDQRNMGEFPAGEGNYIPKDCFFMMGDNRFNSLDMRHSYETTLAPVDPGDAYSFLYRSNLSPRYVPVNRILGAASFRFWPLSRLGLTE